MTEQEKYVIAAAATFKECLEILNRRSKKYTGDEDPFSNFVTSAEIADVDVTQSIMTRFGDKIGRIKQGLENYRNGTGGPAFEDESFADSLYDAINYLTILCVWLDTAGGREFDAFLEAKGMTAPVQEKFPFEVEQKSPGWFDRLIHGTAE